MNGVRIVLGRDLEDWEYNVKYQSIPRQRDCAYDEHTTHVHICPTSWFG